jgi:hypothetical protein
MIPSKSDAQQWATKNLEDKMTYERKAIYDGWRTGILKQIDEGHFTYEGYVDPKYLDLAEKLCFELKGKWYSSKIDKYTYKPSWFSNKEEISHYILHVSWV